MPYRLEHAAAGVAEHAAARRAGPADRVADRRAAAPDAAPHGLAGAADCGAAAVEAVAAHLAALLARDDQAVLAQPPRQPPARPARRPGAAGGGAHARPEAALAQRPRGEAVDPPEAARDGLAELAERLAARLGDGPARLAGVLAEQAQAVQAVLDQREEQDDGQEQRDAHALQRAHGDGVARGAAGQLGEREAGLLRRGRGRGGHVDRDLVGGDGRGERRRRGVLVFGGQRTREGLVVRFLLELVGAGERGGRGGRGWRGGWRRGWSGGWGT